MYLNFSNIREIKKYIDRNPKIAKILEVNTIKGSAVIAKMAGILSKANRISVSSITISATNRGVAAFTPILFTKKA